MELTPGTMIAGRYRIEARVGAGGMGEVWVGEHLAVGARVALKTLLPAAAVNHEVVARFKREAYFLGRIRSDYVARVVDFVADEAVGLVLVMEYIEGDPLSKILQQKTLTVEEAVELGVDIVTALRDLHQAKIIHRDLKPGNIIIQRRYDGSYRAVIVDFGVSRIASNGVEDEEMTGITRADMAVGTIEYMAPEQILNSRDVTPASDLYAVGAILFRALAGHHVFGDLYDVELAKMKLTKDPGALHTGRGDRVAKGLEQVVGTALKRRPKERYDSADKLLADLLALRDLARALALDLDQETTQDNTRNSIPAVLDSTSSRSVTRPRMTSASSLPPDAPPPSSAHAGLPMPSGPPSGRPSSQSVVPVDSSVTMPSARPSSHGSLSGAEAGVLSAPRRPGVPIVATVALVLVALASGAALAVFLMKGRLPLPYQFAPSVHRESVEPVEPAAPATATPAAPVPSAEPSAAPSADASAAPDTPIDLDAPAASGGMPVVAAAKPPPRPAPAPVAVAAPTPKPASPSSTEPSPSPSPSGAGTSPAAAPAPTPKAPSSAATTSPPSTPTPPHPTTLTL